MNPYIIIFLICNLFISPALYSSEKIDHYVWLKKALKLQREIDLHAPLNEATFIGTHNSYNSKFYANPVRYIDPNQLLSITGQLESGVRSIEFDVHWTANNKLVLDLLLCHGNTKHIGCSLFDRHVMDGLKELRDWLRANPNEIVLLYIDRYLDGHEPRLAALLDDYLGNYIYKPAVLRSSHSSADCLSLPTHLTKADILKAGKQLIIVTKGCDRSNAYYYEQNQFKQIWNDYVFAGIGDIPRKYYTFIDATITNFTSYPDCGKSTIFHPDLFHTSVWRIYEDRTLNGSIGHPQKKIHFKIVSELMHCGINWPTMDKVDKNDSRLNATIWSWMPEYPKTGDGHCAIYKIDQGFENIPCEQIKAGYACQEEKTHDMKAISIIGTWSSGESTCQLLAGKNWHFAVPINATQLDKLKISMNATLLQTSWLNYVEDEQGSWHAN